MGRNGPPIDRGWAWIIAAGLFLKCFINGGFLKSYGVFFSAFSDTYGRSASETQLVRSARSALATITGPFGTALSERFTERAVVIAGAVSMSLGFILAFFAGSLEILILTFGIFSGIGVSLINGPSKLCLGRYFDKRRGLANSLALVGASVGQITVPPLVSLLLLNYGLHGTMLIYGGICLNMIITGALLRPLTFYSSDKEKTDHQKDETADSGVLVDAANEFVDDEENKSGFSKKIPQLQRLHSTDNQNYQVRPRLLSKTSKQDNFRGSSLSLTDRLINVGSNLQVNTLPQNDPIDVEIVSLSPETRKKTGVCSTVVAFFKGVFDRRVLTNPLYILFVICTSLCMSSTNNQVTFIVPRAEEIGVSREMAAILVSIVGGCDVFGRLLMGVLADFKFVSSHYWMAIGTALTSVSMYAMPFTKTFGEMAAVAVIFGIFGSTHAIMNLPVLIDFVGKNLLAQAIGISIFCYGGSNCIFAPLLGFVKDVSGSFSTVFYVTASMQALAAILLAALAPAARRHQDSKRRVDSPDLPELDSEWQ